MILDMIHIFLVLHACSCSGSKIFSTFIGFLKSKVPNEGTEQALLDKLTSFDDHLKEKVSLSCSYRYSILDIFSCHEFLSSHLLLFSFFTCWKFNDFGTVLN